MKKLSTQKRKKESPVPLSKKRGSSMANHTERTTLKPRENFN
jgi:hypothetical protein